MWIRLACVQRLYELIAIIGGWADLYSCWHDFFCNRVVIYIIWFSRGGETKTACLPTGTWHRLKDRRCGCTILRRWQWSSGMLSAERVHVGQRQSSS